MNEAEKLAKRLRTRNGSPTGFGLGLVCDEAASLIERQAEQIKLLRGALIDCLLSSDPEGTIATASEDDLTEAANDASADLVVREQAASVLQARSALAATKEET